MGNVCSSSSSTSISPSHTTHNDNKTSATPNHEKNNLQQPSPSPSLPSVTIAVPSPSTPTTIPSSTSTPTTDSTTPTTATVPPPPSLASQWETEYESIKLRPINLIPPPLPPNEQERINTLLSLAIMNTEREGDYDDIVQLASNVTNSPVAITTLIDENTQFHKAAVGIPEELKSIPKDISICAHTILTPSQPYEITDLSTHPLFSHHPITVGMGFRYYYGCPLSVNGNAIGALCVLDKKPRAPMDEKCAQNMKLMAQSVVRKLEDRLKLREIAQYTLRQREMEGKLLLAKQEAENANISSLENLLLSPEGLAEFSDFLKEKLCEESLSFWQAARQFRVQFETYFAMMREEVEGGGERGEKGVEVEEKYLEGENNNINNDKLNTPKKSIIPSTWSELTGKPLLPEDILNGTNNNTNTTQSLPILTTSSTTHTSSSSSADLLPLTIFSSPLPLSFHFPTIQRTMISQAHSIYSTYISPSCPTPINISGAVRTRIQNTLDGLSFLMTPRTQSAITPTVFKDAQAEIFVMLHTDLFPQFVASEKYRTLRKKMQRRGVQHLYEKDISVITKNQYSPLDNVGSTNNLNGAKVGSGGKEMTVTLGGGGDKIMSQVGKDNETSVSKQAE